MLQHKKNGFSLIELVVVIGVIALLATTILTGYNQTNKTYRFSLATDELASQFSALKSKVRTEAGQMCHGVLIDDEGIFLVETNYLNPVQKCGQIPKNVRTFGDGSLVANEIKIDNRIVNQFTYYYVPPFGDIYFPFETVNENTIVRLNVGLANTDREKLLYFIPAIGKLTDVNPVENES